MPMKLSLKTHNGRPEMPVVVLVHGLGMNNYFWDDPEKCHVLGGLAPLTFFMADSQENSRNTISFGSVAPGILGLWPRLARDGFSLASWSQLQPLGPVQIAVDELREVLSEVRRLWPGKPKYLVGHSRGGLIAKRCLLEDRPADIAGLVTVCSPHSGTSLARFSRFLKPAGIFLDKIMPEKSRAMLTKALSRLAAFLQSPAIEELTPDSEFIASLADLLPDNIAKLSFGGTSPSLFQLVFRLPPDKSKIIRFPDLLCGAVPSERLPEELTPGFGDALVSAKSAKLPGGIHHNFPDNHIRAAYDPKIHDIIVEFLR